jgi:hypothetical protein
LIATLTALGGVHHGKRHKKVPDPGAPFRRDDGYGSRNTIVGMSPNDRLRLVVDLSYSGEEDDLVIVFAGCKATGRS